MRERVEAGILSPHEQPPHLRWAEADSRKGIFVRRGILARLEMLRDYVKLSKEYQKRGLEKVRKDATLKGAIKRYLLLALECVFDVGNGDIVERVAQRVIAR